MKYIMICHSTPLYIEQACEIAKAWGKVGSIVECEEPLQFQSMAAFSKALSFRWEFMFTNAVSDDDEMMRYQGGHLKEISRLCEEGKLKSTVTQTFELSAKNLRKAHEILESGKAIGKISLTVEDDVKECCWRTCIRTKRSRGWLCTSYMKCRRLVHERSRSELSCVLF